ncbi:MAG: nuclear transport factor 2 family protein [Pseudomonadota bacterium]
MADAKERSLVLRAHDAFYDAVRAGDIVRLDALISNHRPVLVGHPGWPVQHGRADVMASWAEIFVSGGPPDIWPLDEHVMMTDHTALVVCTEIVGSTQLTATNVFVREAGDWYLTQHMAARLFPH